ncbi:hypothetical protein NPIL_188351 [Nephila pilipes]|uniref:Uncharacterized protein n=1 Tax=Nephila pilipes TaxID=299642 RepID=A0A8X6QJ39_NEPPI|nr:hypothetical protein NPIL_188351 [Nephila pilipes]
MIKNQLHVFRKAAIIYGHMVTTLLDTRSTSCFLKESVARNLRLNILPYEKIYFPPGNRLNPVTQSLGINSESQIERCIKAMKCISRTNSNLKLNPYSMPGHRLS